MKNLSPKKIATFGGAAVVLGIVGLLLSITTTLQPISAESEDDAPLVTVPAIPAQPSNLVNYPVSGRPNHITIASVNIDLPVIDGLYNSKTGAWTLTKTNAQFATPSKLANNTSGTTFIYGHDTKRVFNRLHGIKVGAEVVVTTSNGYRFVYAFHDSVITTPSSVSEVTAPSAKPRLSLQTCYGPTSADRQIFHLYLVRVEKI
jgi:LPXTG-site transpeptidase (sortase) family protein